MMNRMLIIILMQVSLVAAAQEVREFYTGIRSAGMGGAAIAVVNDETSLLANPAGLGKLRDFYGTILDPEWESNTVMGSQAAMSSITDPLNIEQVKSLLDSNYNTYFHAREALFPSFVVRNFGIGIYWRKVLDAQEDSTGSNLNYSYYDDMALVMGYNFRMFDGRVKLGFNGKFISRIAVENVTVATSGAYDVKSNAVEGAGIGTDIGLILTAPWTYLPTISAVVHDVGGTSFNAGSGLRMTVANRPTKILQDYDVAVALFPIHSNRVRSTFTAEYQKVVEAAEATDKEKYMHLGYELNVADLFFVRAGMNQRYWTGGLEFASEHTQIQFGSYGEEIGTADSHIEDRRYVFKFSLRF